MPVIKNYQRQVGPQGPVERRRTSPDEFGAAEARALGKLGQAVGQIGGVLQKREEQKDVSDLNAKFSSKQAQLAVDFEKMMRTSDPGDSTVIDRFNKHVETELSNLGQDVKTSAGARYFEQNSAQVKGHYFKKAFDGQTHLAGVKAQQDYDTTLKGYTSTLLKDPSSFQMNKDQHAVSINNLLESNLISKEQATEMLRAGENTMAKNTMRGWIKMDPVYAQEKLKSKEFDVLTADQKVVLHSEAKQEIRGREIELERAKRRKDEIKKQKQVVTQNDFLEAIEKGELDSKSILGSNLNAFGSGSKDQFLKMLDRKNKQEKMQTNPDTMLEMYERIHLPDGDPRKLTDENELNQFFGNGLQLQDIKDLRAEMQGKRTQAGEIESQLKKGVVDIAKGTLTKSNPLTGVRDPIGDSNLQRFMTFFLNEYKQKRSAGKSATELLDPNSKDYLGKQINQYKRSALQIQKDLIKSLSTNPAQPQPKGPERKAGESVADFLKRTEGK